MEKSILTVDYPDYILNYKGYKAYLTLSLELHGLGDEIRYPICLSEVQTPESDRFKWDKCDCEVFYVAKGEWSYYIRSYWPRQRKIKPSIWPWTWTYVFAETQAEMTQKAIAAVKKAIDKRIENQYKHRKAFEDAIPKE
jgi:hypothetical protein